MGNWVLHPAAIVTKPLRKKVIDGIILTKSRKANAGKYSVVYLCDGKLMARMKSFLVMGKVVLLYHFARYTVDVRCCPKL